MTTQTCLACDFTGSGNCSACHGRGTILADAFAAPSDPLGAETSCSACGGSGECQGCGGLGEIEVGGEG
jgi:hypothetical protein